MSRPVAAQLPHIGRGVAGPKQQMRDFRRISEPTGRLELPTGGLRMRLRRA